MDDSFSFTVTNTPEFLQYPNHGKRPSDRNGHCRQPQGNIRSENHLFKTDVILNDARRDTDNNAPEDQPQNTIEGFE